ncbi:MAG: hypothetical protein E7E23_13370, partial [Paenibacillus sp.]|nr:hypothetical protein [Paenibacillus sp.]
GKAGGPPALPEGFQPPEGFPGDAGAPGDAADGGRNQGGGFPGGDPMEGGRGGFGAAAPAAGTSGGEVLFTGISLLVLLSAAGFVAFFRRKRL